MTAQPGEGSDCPVCRSTHTAVFIDISGVPVFCNALCESRAEALAAPRGEIRLAYCADCGHVFNAAFDPELLKYAPGYETSLHFSPRFQSYAEDTARRLVDRYGLRSKTVLEIGCGQGEFLALLCAAGGNRGLGFDPSHLPREAGGEGSPQITFIQDLYSERYAHYHADLVCCRHVLEHVARPADLLGQLRRTIGDRRETVVFIEVPNVLYTLRDMGIWDLIYEHCSYFSASSLRTAFVLSGFAVRDLQEAYGEQFLWVEALPDGGSPARGDHGAAVPSELGRLVAAFAARYEEKVANWKAETRRMVAAGRRTAIWGGGSKGVTFLNTLGVREEIAWVVDINPRKQGMHVPGTGQPIIAPQVLKDYGIDRILLMNPIYRTEIEDQVRQLGLDAEIYCV